MWISHFISFQMSGQWILYRGIFCLDSILDTLFEGITFLGEIAEKGIDVS